MKKLDLKDKENYKLFKALSVIEEIFKSRAVTAVDRVNFEGSAARVTRMFNEMYWKPEDIADTVGNILKVSFPVAPSSDGEDGMIVHGPTVINSLCPHHYLPVRYHAYMAYIPSAGGKVLGISKLDRIPIALAKRPVLQEQLAKDIADAFYYPSDMSLFSQREEEVEFETEGSIVTLIGIHCCEACRGVKQDARTMVTERRGSFKEATLEARFFAQIGLLDRARPFGS